MLATLLTSLFGAVPSDENLLTIKKTAVPFLIAGRHKLTHGELSGVVIDGAARDLSIDMASTLECPLGCGHVRDRLPPLDLHIRHPRVLVTFKRLTGGNAVP